MLIPHLKPTSRVNSTKDKHYYSAPNAKRAQKRQSDGFSAKPFSKIRLQRPMTPTSPNTTVKLEPLDLPLSPNQLYPGESTENFENLMNLHEEDDPGGEDGDYDGPHDLNDDQMEFVPTDFLEQEQDIVEEMEANGDRDSNDEGELTIDEDNCRDNYDEMNKETNVKIKEKKTNPKRDDSQTTRRKEEFAKDREKAGGL